MNTRRTFDESEFDESEDDLEQGLAAELRPVQPSPGFADAVMLCIAQQNRRRGSAARNSGAKLHGLGWREPWTWLALAAALLLLLLPADYALRIAHRQRQAQLTQARFDLAMRLTSRTLAHVDATIDGTLQRAAATPRNSSSN